MGKIDWYCKECAFAFRAFIGKCTHCNKHIRPVNCFELNKKESEK